MPTPITRLLTAAAAGALLTAGLCGCSGGDSGSTAIGQATASTATTAKGATPAGAPTSAATAAAHAQAAAAATATAGSATTAKPAPPPGLHTGSKGPDVLALEQRLDALKYSVGKVDDTFDSVTTEGVIAFQKVSGLPRTGRATPDVVAALNAAGLPAPLMPTAEPTRVEVDLPHQVLYLYENGALTRTLMISSGGGYRYCVKGSCAKAVTPGGAFHIGTKITGRHVAPLGVLYNPLFFNGGIAIHGEPAVPTYPASHGCVRIPMSASKWFYDRVQRGTPVYVLGGPKAPVPFNTPGPDGEAPDEPQTPPTTAAPAVAPTTATPQTTAAPTTTTTVPATTTTTTPPPTTPSIGIV